MPKKLLNSAVCQMHLTSTRCAVHVTTQITHRPATPPFAFFMQYAQLSLWCVPTPCGEVFHNFNIYSWISRLHICRRFAIMRTCVILWPMAMGMRMGQDGSSLPRSLVRELSAPSARNEKGGVAKCWQADFLTLHPNCHRQLLQYDAVMLSNRLSWLNFNSRGYSPKESLCNRDESGSQVGNKLDR